MTIRAVFFDMGGTIETFWHTRQLRLEATPSFQQALRSVDIHLGLSDEKLYELVVAGLDRYHRWSLQSLEELPPGRVWQEFIFADYPAASERLLASGEALMQYIELNYYHREMRPEMPAVLDAIQAMDLKIGLISNVCSRGQVPANLEKYGLRKYFDPIVLSSEYGRRKPDPAIFHYAARLADVPTSGCIYIGDRIARDVLGSQRAGYFLSIQIRHDFDHGETDEGATPDLVIERMTDLLDILRAEMSASTRAATTEGMRALLFDAGDILYFRPNTRRRLRKFLGELGIHGEGPSQAEIEALKHQAFQGRMDQDQYREALLRMYGLSRPEDFVRGKQVIDEEDNDVQFFPGVRETLVALKKKGFLLGIITDTALPVSVKLGWFERGGFGNVWDSIISSRELKIRKPNPAIYQAALRQLGMRREQAAFVGHKTSELDGARSMGMKTIAFNYEESAKADYYIQDFSDLLKVPILLSSEPTD